jgi:hypothetical protein
MAKNLSSILRGTNYGTLPISSGGTGATSAEAALAALGAQATLSAATSSANGYLTSADWTTFNSKQATLSAANGTTNGYLTSADWTTFNNKQAALGTASASVNGILSSTDWSTFNNKQTALSNASASVSGILTSTDWSTFNGKQAALVSGTNIKSVNGTTLLGSGDLVITGGASATKTIDNKTAAYTVVAADLGKIINCTGGTFTVSLTAAATLGSGFTCTIWNTSNTATNAITIDPNLTETIDGKATLILRIGEGLNIICDGTNWQIDNKKPMRGYAENYDNTADRPVATGFGATALGYQTTASSIRSVAIGANANGSGSVATTGAGAMALGGSYASGADSFAAAVANNTSTYGALGANSVAIGYQCKTGTGGGDTAIGYAAVCTGSYAISIGINSSTTGTYAVSIGTGAAASAQSAVAIGTDTIASERGAIAIGTKAKAAQWGKIAFGSSKSTSAGMYQSGKMVLGADTTTSTAVLLTTDTATTGSTTNQLIVATSQAMTFFGILIAKQTASNNMASYKVSGAISNNAGTMVLADVTVEKIVDTIGLTTEPTFTADSTNKALAITSGAKLTTTIKWSCNVDTVEVIFA